MATSGNVINDDISPAQCRAARALIAWSQDELAARSGVPKRTIARLELGETTPRAATIAALRAALEAAGVVFVAENGGGPGVRLKKKMEVEEMATTTLIGLSGRAYLFEEISSARFPSAPGLIMLTTVHRSGPSVSGMLGPTIGFTVSLSDEAERLAEEQKPMIVHGSNLLVCRLDGTISLRDAWNDLRNGGAEAVPTQRNAEPFLNSSMYEGP